MGSVMESAPQGKPATKRVRATRNEPAGGTGNAVRTPSPSRSTIRPMQVVTGTVVNGKIVLEGVVLREGAVVTIVTRGADENFSLTAEQEDELLEAMAEIERGEHVSLDQLLQSLPKQS